MADNSKPKKRGRPAKNKNVEPAEDENIAEAPPRKRVRAAAPEEAEEQGEPSQPAKPTANPPKKGPQERSGGDDTADSSVRRSKRDRRSADDNPWWNSNTNETSPPAQQPGAQAAKQPVRKPQIPPKKNSDKVAAKSAPQKPSKEPTNKTTAKPPRRKTSRPNPPTQLENQPSLDQNRAESVVRRSARDRRSADDNPWWSSNQGESSPKDAQPQQPPGGPPKKKKRGRPSLGEVSVSQAQNSATQERTAKPGNPGKRGSGRPSLNSEPDGPSSKPNGQSSRRTSDKPTAFEKPRKTGPRSSAGAAPESRRRSDPSEPSGPADPAPIPVPKYQHLASRTRQIPRATISAKWTTLDDASAAAVDAIVTDAARPVLFRLRDRDARHQQAQKILRVFASRLQSKLRRGMPFPPPTSGATKQGVAGSSHELELDFERTVDAIQGLEKTLDPLLHSVALLEAERDREEAALEREYKLLKTLEANAKAEAREWRERGKRDHVLAPERRAVEEGRQEEVLGTASTEGAEAGVFTNLKEQDLVALSQRIGNHMESMKGNLKQIDGVLPAIVKSKAALQGVLHQYLDPAQYDQAVLG
ncbi:CENP-Q, a CENPA-CAD centromere complex subunit-domain-containing protein [Lasiosphaeris hirsuta]|uniref:CENP-Q, a CENPA-CAD centromere complex subunit-domain-containing protein n=1 Tax=Lasiosphaeris hirsuta TaxID=260670 RepID=A0AA39ZXM9_9PEZI|nr:CENP-Q, a CENPA-CAD centromere complex subunit-domain-containing protein [Lasiosphaeris hirsuta]